MQFYHPEILFGLFALAIPIIVHLFQLRKFKTEPFTNVVLLKKLVISSRKSSQLKKWLSLITRLLIITCLVLAFAQPFIPNSSTSVQNKQFSIFLDNSYSMSLKGENTKLFDQIKDNLLEVLPQNEIYHLATHDESFKNLDSESFKSWIYDLDYTASALDLNAVLSKTQNLLDNTKDTQNEIIILSDFQTFKEENQMDLNSEFNYHFVKYEPRDQINFSIDTAYLQSTADENALKFKISASQKTTQNLPVSLYNGKELLGKFSMDFEDESQKEYSFNLEQKELLNARIQIEDAALAYDNTLFFTISKPEPIKVLVISEEATPYLDKIYNNERFDYQQNIINTLQYADISQSDVVILNELQQIPNALQISLENFVSSNAVLGIIPSKDAELKSYNDLFAVLGLRPYADLNENSIKLTNIQFGHPVFENVFTEEVQNFDYPTFESYFESNSSQKALSFSNGLAFLESKNQVFRFNAPITDNSDFKQSPLVVLSFYNLALQTQNKADLYAKIGETFQFNLKTDLNQDEVLTLSQGKESFIPQQQSNGKSITLNFFEYPKSAGHFVVTNPQKDTLTHLAFNQNRRESQLNYLDVSSIQGVKTYERFTDYTQKFNDLNEIRSLWQWFIILALIFMIIELLLLRFIK